MASVRRNDRSMCEGLPGAGIGPRPGQHGAMEFTSAAARVLDSATALGAAYADVRFERVRAEHIEVRNGEVAALGDERSVGYGVRALVDGAWGFAASAGLDDAALDAAAGRAVAMARGATVNTRRLGTAPTAAYVDEFATPVERDPAGIPVGERVALLLEAERGLHAAQHRDGRAWIDLWHVEKEFSSTAGSRVRQTIVQSAAAGSARSRWVRATRRFACGRATGTLLRRRLGSDRPSAVA